MYMSSCNRLRVSTKQRFWWLPDLQQAMAKAMQKIGMVVESQDPQRHGDHGDSREEQLLWRIAELEAKLKEQAIH